MRDSFQDVYAKHLQHADYGYPLRMPEPMSTLPQNYQDDGLQIGDVGTVDSRGQFDVLFNIFKRSDNPLHDSRGVPKNFQPVQLGDVKYSDNPISPGPIHSHGIQRILQPGKPRPADYEFDTSTAAGAILILPQGAVSLELSLPDRLREVARKSALDWFEFAKKHYGVEHLDRSLYLVTGFYKARSWSLGSFNNPTDATGKILARRDDNNHNIYLLEFTFPADCRHRDCGDDSGSNQTVFITGFKITVSSWLPDPVVLRVTESETTWSILVRLLKACLSRLRGFSDAHKQRAAISVEHSPQLSQPFHPSDIINRFLLSKNRNAKVAITHDNQWMDMMKEGLRHEDLLHEDRLETFLTRCYTISVDSEGENSTVFLQGKANDTMDSVSSLVDPQDTSAEPEMSEPLASGFELEASSPPTSELEFSPPPTPSIDNPRIVIRCIRARNIRFPLHRIPVGFFVLVQSGSDQRRTQIKSMQLNDSIEWEDEILLPSRAFDKVRFTVYAPFELEPMLGNGEVLHTSESPVEELVGGTHLITFPSGELEIATPEPSLLVTLGQRYSNQSAVALSGDDSNLHSEESLNLIHETNLGQEALLRYHREYQREDLDHAVRHFERAWRNCPSTHRCRAVVLANLAKVKFISYQTDPTGASLDEPIQLYRQALDLRRRGHLDRPTTLLQLAQTLLFRYEKQGCNEAVADEINELMTEFQDFSDESPECKAANFVLEMVKRCRAVNSGDLVELEKLDWKLQHSKMVPPDGYLDRPRRLIKLSTAMWGECEKHGKLSDLDHLLELSKQALRLLPSRHPDRLPGLRTLGGVLWRLFEVHDDLSYLRELIVLCEEALQLIPEGHPEHPYWVTNFNLLLCSFF